MKARNWTLGVMAAVYLSLLLAKRVSLPLPTLVSSYLADLLCMPLLLSVSLLSVRWLMRKPSLLLSKAQVFFVFAYVGFAFEYLLPSLHERYIADPVDLVCYSIGALFFLLYQKALFSKQSLARTRK